MGKPIEVVPAPDKEVFSGNCQNKDCKKWRPLTWYEASHEAAKIVALKLKGKKVPPDGERMFFGAYCSTECLEANNFKLWEELEDGEKEEVDTGGGDRTEE